MHKIVLNKARNYTKKFKSEFNKAILAAVVSAFGLLIALVWKDVITEFVNKLTSLSPLQGKIVYSIAVSIICVMGIILATEILSPKEDKNLENKIKKDKQLQLQF